MSDEIVLTVGHQGEVLSFRGSESHTKEMGESALWCLGGAGDFQCSLLSQLNLPPRSSLSIPGFKVDHPDDDGWQDSDFKPGEVIAKVQGALL